VTVTKAAMDLGQPTVGPKPAVRVTLMPGHGAASSSGEQNIGQKSDAASTQPPEITVIPGQMTTAWLRIERNGFNDRVTFDVENLPHGVIVADIGLSGVLIAEGQTERQIFIHCPPWVSEQVRPCHARAREAGNPTSAPLLLRVKSEGRE
jgi:hypothetical protein